MTSGWRSALDPAVAAFSRDWEIETSGAPAERRRQMAHHMAGRLSGHEWPDDWRDHVELREIEVPVADRAVPVRVFSPRDPSSPAPVLVYMFGGAWWLRGDDPPDADHLCGSTAVGAGAIVVDVRYALSPEAPFPRALDEIRGVLAWVAAGGLGPRADARRLAIGGISAGANLAAATCLRLRDEGGPAIALQILEVPLLDVVGRPDEFVDFYLQGHDRADPLVSPVRTPSAAGLPPALILVAELDEFAAEGRAYGNLLRSSGVEATTVVFDGQGHLTPSLWPVTPSARAWRRLVTAELRALAEVPS